MSGLPKFEYESLNWISSPSRNPDGTVELYFYDDAASLRFQKSLHAKGFMLNWINVDTPIKKYQLSDHLYHQIDSNVALRDYYLAHHLDTPQGIGALLMPNFGQYIYQIAAIPGKVDLYYIVVWIQGNYFIGMDVGFIHKDGIQVIEEECFYSLPNMDIGMGIMYVSIFLQLLNKEDLRTSTRIIQGHQIEFVDYPKK